MGATTGHDSQSDEQERSGMAAVSLQGSRPVGKALVVASPAARAEPLNALQQMGYGCHGVDDPYAALAELCRRPLVYRALVLSLAGVYKEELCLIPTVKQRFPHVEVWLAHTDGRQGFLADALRLGADGLLADDALHRLGGGSGTAGGTGPLPLTSGPHPGMAGAAGVVAALESQPPRPASPAEQGHESGAAGDGNRGQALADDHEAAPGEPVLTADELRALLQEQAPPFGSEG